MTALAGKDGRAEVEGREIWISRVFNAPREMVWEVWTKPEHISNWWGPRGFSTTTQSMDVRAGGEWKLVMHGPDGTDYAGVIRYDEVTAPSVLRYRHGGAGADVVVNFDAEGQQTRVTMRMTFASVEEMETVRKRANADEGMAQTIARLGEYLVLHKARTMGAMPAEGAMEREIVLTRVLKAPRELVWAAWTEPEHMMQWWGPRAYSCPKAEIDLRPGGKMLMVMRGPDGADMPCAGEVVEVKAPERLVFKTYVDGPDGKRLLEGLNTVTLTEQDGKTVMTLVAKAKAMQKMAIPMLAGMEMGWTQSLEKMEAHLAAK